MVLGCMAMTGNDQWGWLGTITLVAIALVITGLVKGSGAAPKEQEHSLPAYPFAIAEAPRLHPEMVGDSAQSDSLVEV